MAQKKNQSNLVTAILYILVGLLLCILRDSILDIMFTIAGVIFIVLGNT